MFDVHKLSYSQTSAFSKIILDYTADASKLASFFSEPPSLEGIKKTIAQKREQPLDRELLVQTFNQQYSDTVHIQKAQENIERLRNQNTFTVCTAHQPNILTGPLYFIYKIVHAIKLADFLNTQFPEDHFVPVYYMGSEDADFAELNHLYIDQKKYEWQTDQTGAVGRMLVDKKLLQLINELEGQLSVLPFGTEVLQLFKTNFTEGKKIQDATFGLVHQLFGHLGLLVLIADNEQLKQQMIPVFKDDLFEEIPSQVVQKTCERLQESYTIQAPPRAINLFYLKDDIRERIEKQGNQYVVHHTNIRFSKEELQAELEQHAERFSPNVILRGLYQETILPNVAFIGGGGELAYWLQLKDLFQHYKIVYPVLVLRNSFLIIPPKEKKIIEKLQISLTELFQPAFSIINNLLERQGKKAQLNGEVSQLINVYDELKGRVQRVDTTLLQHVEALKTASIKKLEGLEKKMMRAERKKEDATYQQIQRLKGSLFPHEHLQERMENFSSFYGRWGTAFIDEIYEQSLTLEQQFVVMEAKEN